MEAWQCEEGEGCARHSANMYAHPLGRVSHQHAHD